MKTHKRMLAALLLAAMLLSMLAVPAAAADEFVYGSAIMSLGQKGDAAKTVNLTTEGDVAWTYFAVNRPGNNISKADQEDAAIQLSDTKGALSYSTADKIVHFQFTNGANPENNNGSYQTEARGLIFQGKGNGFTLTVPASEAPRTLRIYMGDYKAKLRADIYKGNTLVQSRIFDNQGETKMPMLEIGYCSTEAIKVVITITDVYDSSYGSISLHAATVQDGAEEPELVSGKVTKLEGQTYGINLTDEGNVDWMFFNGNTPEAYEHRRMQERFITEIEGIGDGKYAGQTDDNPLRYTFTNGMFTPEANQMRAPLLVCYGVGTGVSFQVPGGPVERTLHLYCGTWAMESQVKLMVNGEEKYATELFGKTATDDGAFYYVVEITYQTESADDEVEVTFQGVRGYSPAYQNCSLEAITLFSENPPQVTEPDYTEETLETASVYACHPYGRLRELHFKEGEEWLDIPLRTTQSTAGPAWQVNGKSLLLTQKDNDSHAYETTIDGVTYGIAYSAEEDGTLNIQATIQNNSGKQYTPDRASIVLGFDTYMMDRYNDYKDLFFPTLLRCEKDYMWGYFQSPQNKVISFTVDAPVSSYRLNYESSLHRIYTATLDLMQKDAVNRPARHPGSENDVMEAGTSRTWNIKLKLTDGAQQVQQDVAEMVKAPMITADRYTLGENERAQITVYSEKPVQSVTVDKLEDGNAPNVRSKDGEQDTLTTGYISCDALSLRDDGNGMYTASFLPAKGAGVYRLRVIDADGYTSEAIITLRNTWSWYMENAMIQGAKHYPRGGTHAESYYNAYSVYLGEKYFDLEQSTNGQFTEDSFDEIYFRDVYDVIGYEDENGNPINPRESAARIQNHSTTVGQLADRYEATGDVESLKKAIPIVDFLISRQNASGAYMGPSGDYTSVIYPAKSIMELMYHEAELAQTDTENAAFWQENYDKQYASVKKAMDSLVTLDGDLHTEGQLTFEDGAYSCSTTQLSEFALIARSAGDPDWEKYRDSAIRYAVKHEALEQQIIPDSRMNGGSLRFWEAQYDTLVTASPNNMMNSPHGWTAWNIYGLFNLYQLTGDVDYLERGMNAMGSCAQLMGFDGNLYWAFIADPYVPSSQLVQVEGDTSELGTATRRNINIGECYVDTITDWFRSEPGTVVGGYWGQGGSCDNDVHEIFKALEECVLTKAFVVENADGSYTAYNCSTVEENGVLTITADPEELTSEISLNLQSEKSYHITFSDGKTANGTAAAGLTWVEQTEGEPEVRYTVTVKPDVEHGTITVSPALAAEGEKVTITVTPDRDYQLVENSLKVYQTGNETVLVSVKDNVFEMPAYNVTVEAAFELVEPGHTHSMSHVEAKDATCTEPGNVEYWHCDGCGKNFADAEGKEELTTVTTPIDRDNHVHTKLEGYEAATILTPGYTGDLVCQDCRTVVKKGEVIPRKGSGIIIPIDPGMPSYELPFVDVPEGEWYYESVYYAWDADLIDGTSATTFRPDHTLTVAQAIKLASALHQLENEGKVTLTNGKTNWYDTYVAYAVQEGIIEAKYQSYTAAQMNAPAKRNEFVHILHGALDEYEAINAIGENAIPDVKTGDKYAAEIYDFYRAGILTGSNAEGTFHPESSIKRSEVAAILVRMFDESMRESIDLL